MTAPGTVVVVGAGLAGGTAAATLREEGFTGRVVLIGAEPLPPYERPPLSKEVLRGERPPERTAIRAAGAWGELEIELRLGTRVEHLDASARDVILAGGERIAFDAAVVATGGANRHLEVPGAELPGIWDLRTVGDAAGIAQAAGAGGHAVIVGMGFIGAEVAASLRSVGLEVTVVEVFETSLFGVLGAELGRAVEALHRDHGVRMIFGDSVGRFEGAGRVERVVTRAGRSIDCSMVVVGIGTDPAGDLLGDDAVEVDAVLETAIPGVYAVGDVARHDHPLFGPIRVEHFENAWKMGQVAAGNVLGRAEPFDDPHWFWSDQYDSTIEMTGVGPWDEMVVRGSIPERSFAAFLLLGGVLRAAVTMDRPREARRAAELIRRRMSVAPEVLADPDVDLRTLVRPDAPDARG